MRFKFTSLLLLGAFLCLSAFANAQQTVTTGPYMAVLSPGSSGVITGKPITLDIFVMDSTSMAPRPGLSFTATLTMPAMTMMGLDTPKVSLSDQPGHYTVSLTLPHPGNYMLDLAIRDSASHLTSLVFHLTPSAGSDQSMAGMDDMSMKGSLGNWSMSREGSGTSWQPDESPMFMKMLPSAGGLQLSTMGIVQAGYVRTGGLRGDTGFFTNSMLMLMGRKETGGGTLGLDFMTSLDPIANGERGVPNLFQTGETENGVPLVDRQHPHNLFSEVAASYSHPLSKDWSGFVYGGQVGEPALGNVMFMHRPSGLEIPEAPISHHWFDSTHISFGVLTGGLVYQDKWKFEASAFNGHEPGENRYIIESPSLNSASARLSYNPSPEWSLSASYGYLDSPEALSPGINEHRITASAAYSHNLASGDDFSATAYFGQKLVEGQDQSNAWLVEGTYYHQNDAIFARFERADKDELTGVPAGSYTVNKLLFGDVHTFARRGGFDYGVGAYAGLYSYPSSLDAFYGKNPVTLGLFLRVRPTQM